MYAHAKYMLRLQDKLILKAAKRAAKKAERKEARQLGGVLRKADEQSDALKQKALIAELTKQCKATVVKVAMAVKLSSNDIKTLQFKADQFMTVAKQKALKAAAKLKSEAAASVTKARQAARMTKAQILRNAKAAAQNVEKKTSSSSAAKPQAAEIVAAAKHDANKSAQKVQWRACPLHAHIQVCVLLCMDGAKMQVQVPCACNCLWCAVHTTVLVTCVHTRCTT